MHDEPPAEELATRRKEFTDLEATVRNLKLAIADGLETRRLALLPDTEREVHFSELQQRIADLEAKLAEAQAEVERLRDELMQLKPREGWSGSTHWEECWRVARHHECAVAEIERLRELIKGSLEKGNEQARRLIDAATLHLADEQTIRTLKRRLASADEMYRQVACLGCGAISHPGSAGPDCERTPLDARAEAEALVRGLAELEGPMTPESAIWAREETVEALEGFRRDAQHALHDWAGARSGGPLLMRSEVILALVEALNGVLDEELRLVRTVAGAVVAQAEAGGQRATSEKPAGISDTADEAK